MIKTPFSCILNVKLFFFFSLAQYIGFAQQGQVIQIKNGGFESDYGPAAARQPDKWQNAGFPGETAPDTQDGEGRIFGVVHKPHNGNTFLGMVVRDNAHFECVRQKLSKPLEASKTYKLTIWLSGCEHHLSQSRMTGNVADYNEPVKFRIGVGNDEALSTYNIVYQSEPIDHVDWKEYTCVFTPRATGNLLYLEAFYANGIEKPYNGSILIDDLSDITEVSTSEAFITLLEENDNKIEKLLGDTFELTDYYRLSTQIQVGLNATQDILAVTLKATLLKYNTFTIYLYDPSGTEVLNKRIEPYMPNNYPVDNLPAGVYFYKVMMNNEDQIGEGTIVINRS